MSDPHWENLKDLFHAALAVPVHERAAYLEQACNGDTELRGAVESLLKSNEESDHFLDAPAYQAAAEMLVANDEFKPNQIVAHYRIISLLREGGMGKVYLAEDTKLHRRVALKFLASNFTQDQDRLERFAREARAASALNHPNILTIHEIGESEGRRFIATEFIEGKTLHERLSTGLNTEEALDIAIQIASALVAAHRVGIIHRDIKPENVMIRRDDGLVKVLDFGLAKMSRSSSIERAKSVDKHALGQFKTGPGVVIGTVAYMSPEQARGDAVDARTDIWSLGVILYEMICGTSPFIAATSNEIISAILSKTPSPSLSRYAQELPESLEEIVEQALAKNNDERYQTSQDLLIDLKRAQHSLRLDPTVAHHRLADTAFVTPRAKATDPSITTTRPALSAEHIEKPATARKRNTSPFPSIVDYLNSHDRVLLAGLAVVIVTAAAIGWYRLTREHRQNSRSVASLAAIKIKRFTSDGRSNLAAISPDGKYLVHVLNNGEQQSLQMRQVSTYSDEKQIAVPADVSYGGLTFSTNGDYIYYIATQKNGDATLYQMPALGGPSKKLIVDIDTPITFSPDGRQFAFDRGYPDQGEDALIVANADGTGEQKLATRKRDYWWPAWSPDGKVIASRVTHRESDTYDSVVAVQVDDGTVKPITPKRWSVIGEMVWLRDGSGLVMTASEERSEPMQIWYLSYPGGEAHKITNDLNDYESIGLTSDSATLVAVRSEGSSNIWTLPHGETNRAAQLTFTNLDGFKGMSWTPDNHLVYESWASGNSDLWISDAYGSNPKQLTTDSRHNGGPVVSPDGKYVVFYSNDKGRNHIWRMDVGGSNLRQLTDGPGERSVDISPDSQWIVFGSLVDDSTAVWKVPIDGGIPVRLTTKPSGQPTVSPDGRLIACNYMEDGRWKIAIIPFEGGQPVKTFDSFTHPNWLPFHWTPDGRALAYIDQRVPSSIWSVPLSGGPSTRLVDFKSGRVFDFAWSRDGSQLAVARGEAASDVVLINNFAN
jgi:serine/threonine protein kinase